jgi:tRNA uracil 4-sulfurtransferase
MHFVVKLFPEIVIKSPPVRRQQTKILHDNIQRLLKPLGMGIKVVRDWEKIEVSCDQDDSELHASIVDCLRSTPGISKFSEAQTFEYRDLDHICSLVLEKYKSSIGGKSFGVRAKRSGQQSFNSMDVERAVGSALMTQTEAASVDLKNPDIWVELEVRGDRIFLLGESWLGLGGFPIGSQDKVISLISGGFDSSVSSFQAMRRGMLTHFLFFNIGGRAHEVATRQMAHHLWNRYGRSHESRFVSLPFEKVVSEIAEKVPPSYATVILKRYMMRCASRVAAAQKIDAISTGESVGQVSSQTLANLKVIDGAASCLVMRPLINMDKGAIIDIAREIGTANMAAASPEYCGINSIRPTTKASQEKVEEIEASLDPELVDLVVGQAKQTPLSRIIEDIATLPVDIFSKPTADSVVIDVRHPDERLERELQLENNRVVVIPFFEIQKVFSDQPQSANYLLYCDRGIMSRLHAELLLEAGFQNVGVYRP